MAITLRARAWRRINAMDEPQAVEFEGRKYTLFGRYYRVRRRFLHRDIWSAAHGPIPSGHHIHHRDGNRFNNRVENLECIEARAHLSAHSRARPSTIGDRAREGAARWHKSDAGRAWHRKHAVDIGLATPKRYFVACEQCHKPFSGTACS